VPEQVKEKSPSDGASLGNSSFSFSKELGSDCSNQRDKKILMEEPKIVLNEPEAII
jgi:hypothetical protein